MSALNTPLNTPLNNAKPAQPLQDLPTEFAKAGADLADTAKTTARSIKSRVSPVSKEVGDFITDVESMLKDAANLSVEQLASLRTLLADHLQVARHSVAEAADATKRTVQQAARSTDDYVHDNPWTCIGAAAGAALVVGFLLGRR